jgi:hypothetical protein
MRPYSLRNLPNTSDRTGTALCSAGLKGWHALYCRVSWSDVPRVDVSDTHRLKSLEDENAKLKRLLADIMLDNVVLRDLSITCCLGSRWSCVSKSCLCLRS